VSRPVVTARCRRRRHVLATVEATEDGLVLDVRRTVYAGVGKPGQIRHETIPGRRQPFDPSETQDATCLCGGEYLIMGRRLDRAMRDGVSTVICHPQTR
jgi:hypothetical protein